MRWLLSILALFVALAVTGCPPCNPGQPEVFYEDFESWCGELPCAWSLEEGLARKVSTYHTEEHAVELSDGARLILEPEDLRLAATLDPDSLSLMLLCDREAGLAFELVVEQEGAEFSLWAEWNGPVFVDDSIEIFIEMWILVLRQESWIYWQRRPCCA